MTPMAVRVVGVISHIVNDHGRDKGVNLAEWIGRTPIRQGHPKITPLTPKHLGPHRHKAGQKEWVKTKGE